MAGLCVLLFPFVACGSATEDARDSGALDSVAGEGDSETVATDGTEPSDTPDVSQSDGSADVPDSDVPDSDVSGEVIEDIDGDAADAIEVAPDGADADVVADAAIPDTVDVDAAVADDGGAEVVANRAPSCLSAGFDPASVTVLDTVTCSCTDFVDPDGDPEAGTTCHLSGPNGALTPIGTDGCTAHAGQLVRGDTLTCSLIAADGLLLAEEVSATTVLVNHAPGTPDAPTIVPGEDPLDAAHPDATIVCEPDHVNDPDHDLLLYEVTWLVNGLPIGSDLAPFEEARSVTLGELAGVRDDLVGCSVRAFDGFAYSDAVYSATLKVDNSPPVVSAVTLADTTVDARFTCVASATDADGDPLAVGVLWQVTVGDEVSYLDQSATSIAATLVPRTGTVACIAVVNDGLGYVEGTSNEAIVVNRVPVLGALALTSSQPGFFRNATLTCQASGVSDGDEDAIAGVSYTWTVNDVLKKTETLAVGSGSTLTAFAVDDAVTCTANATDGYDAATPVAESATIVNHVPVCNSASISPDIQQFANSQTANCNCNNRTDYDGDVTGNACWWSTYDGTLLPDWGTSCSRAASLITDGWTFRCNIAPVDPYTTGTGASDYAQKTGGGGPSWADPGVTLTASKPLPLTVADGDTVLTCAWNHTAIDPEGTGVSYKIWWSLEGQPFGHWSENDETQASRTLSSVKGKNGLIAGDKVSCYVGPFDGYNTGGSTRSNVLVLASTDAVLGTLTTSSEAMLFPGDVYTCDVTLIDPDGAPPMRTRIQWNGVDLSHSYPDDGVEWSYVSEFTGNSLTASLAYTLSGDAAVTLSALRCVVEVDNGDGYEVLATSEELAYSLFQPTVSVALAPEDSTPCEERICTIVVEDDDAAVLDLPVTLDLEWHVDGEAVSVVAKTVLLTDQTTILSESSDGIPVGDGSEVFCKARIRKSVLPSVGGVLSSNTVTVNGGVPSVASVRVSDPARSGDIVRCTAGEVTPGCATDPVLYYQWYVDGTLQAGQSAATFDTDDVAAGSAVSCGVRVAERDGGAGTEHVAASIVLGASTWQITGEAAGDIAGAAVAVLGDIDGDGFEELVIGAPGADPATGGIARSKAGKVYLVPGSDTTQTTALADVSAGAAPGLVLAGQSGSWPLTATCLESTGTAQYSCGDGMPGTTDGAFGAPRGDGLGTSLSAVGDLDGDGLPELALAAPYAYANGAYLAGRVFVLSGAALALAAHDDDFADLAPGDNALFDIHGAFGVNPSGYGGHNYAYDGHLAGYGLASGDFDGDGLPDLAIGAPNADTHGDNNGGAYVVTDLAGLGGGANLASFTSASGTTPQGRAVAGPVNLATFFMAQMGSQLVTLSDVDGNGADDLLLAPHAGQIANTAAILLGTADAPDADLADPDEWVLTIDPGVWGMGFNGSDFRLIDAVTSGRMMLASLADSVGDSDGDGLADLAVPYFQRIDNANRATIAVVRGAVGFDEIDLAMIEAGVGGFIIAGRPGEGSIGGGVNVWPVGDVDGDGLAEIAFTLAPSDGNSVTIEPAARLYVVWGKTDSEPVDLATLELGALATAGFTIDYEADVGKVTHGDIDGDGLSDIVVGLAGRYAGASAGAVEVVFGRDFRGHISGKGESGADVLVGTSGVDHLIGLRGDDLLDGAGGADVLYGGAGDDVLVVDDDVVRADGGAGTNTLRLAGSSLDLGALRSRVARVAIVDLLDGAHTLTVSSDAVLRLSQSSNELIVLGDAGDVLDGVSGDWILDDEPAEHEGETLVRYVDGNAELWVAPAIDTRFDPVLLTPTFALAEDAAPGTLVGTVAAHDPDGSVVSIEVIGGDPFGIFTFDTGSHELEVVDSTRLDYETRTRWTLTVEMTDDDGLVSTGYVVVALEDMNEAPTFDAVTYPVTLVEGTGDGTIAVRIHASDIDAGDTLSYAIVSGNSDGAFTIEAATGIVSIADGTLLDFESDSSRTVGLLVTDAGGLTAPAVMQVTVTDVSAITHDVTLHFITRNQNPLSTRFESFHRTYHKEISQAFDDQSNEDIELWPGGYLETEKSGTLDVSVDGDVSTGYVSVYAPVDLSLGFPDTIALGTPFVIDFSWELNDTAQLWGETASADLGIKLDLEDLKIGLDYYDATGHSDKSEFGPVTVGHNFTWKLDKQAIAGAAGKTLFPNGYTPVSREICEETYDKNFAALDYEDYCPTSEVYGTVEEAIASGDCPQLADAVAANEASADLSTSCMWRWTYMGMAMTAIATEEFVLATGELVGQGLAATSTNFGNYLGHVLVNPGDDDDLQTIKQRWAEEREEFLDFVDETDEYDFYKDQVLQNWTVDIGDTDKLIMSNFESTTALSVPLYDEKILAELFGFGFGFYGSPGKIWWAQVDVPIGTYGFIRFYYALWSAFLDLRFKMLQAYLLEVKGVTGTLTLEDGTAYSDVSLAAPLSITLPLGADVNGDGRVTFTLVASIEQKFVHQFYVLPGFRYYGELLYLYTALHAHKRDLTGDIVGSTKLNDSYIGPVSKTDTGFSIDVWDLTDAWELPGFAPITITGAFQVP